MRLIESYTIKEWADYSNRRSGDYYPTVGMKTLRPESKPLRRQGGANTSTGSGSRSPRPSPSAPQPRPHTSGSCSTPIEHFRPWVWTSGCRMVRRYVGAVRACRAAGPLAQGQRARAAAGSCFLGHYATAVSLRKTWGLGLRVTSLPAPVRQATAGKGLELRLVAGRCQGGSALYLRISGAQGSLGEAVFQMELLDLANKNAGSLVKLEF